MTEQLPIFVYGTLRRGFHNYNAYLAGKIRSCYEASTDGVLYEAYKDSFPSLVEGDRTVKGELMYIDDFDSSYEDVLRSLDHLEGYRDFNERDSMYIRRKRVVRNDVTGINVEAWVYIWNREVDENLLIKGGCFKEHRRKREQEHDWRVQ